MLIRIVRMEFKEENVDNFLEIFHSKKSKIAAFPGCHEVKLFQDSAKNNVFYTHSIWDNEEALNNYRNSEFFQATWAKTKKLFAEKPLAYSLVAPI